MVRNPSIACRRRERRVVLIPLVKVSEFEQGRCEVKFTRFGAFFLINKPPNGSGGEMKAEYISNVKLLAKEHTTRMVVSAILYWLSPFFTGEA